jgi:alpha-galactosidase
MPLRALAWVGIARHAVALDNGFRLPAMGWSSWYGFTSNINEQLVRDIADGITSSGLDAYGYKLVALDDGWAAPRNSTTNVITADPALFPSGMAALSAYVASKGLSFGIYTDRGNFTCLKRPGSFGFEALDAQTYANWGVNFVKEDSCYGSRAPEIDYGIMRDALNATGRHMAFCVCNPGFGNSSFGNQWRTGPDLYSQAWDMVINRWGLAVAQASLTGPGGFPDPDNLEVGYSP